LVIETYAACDNVFQFILSGFELLVEIFTGIELFDRVGEITGDEVLDLVSLTSREILHVGVDRGSEDERRAVSKSGEGDKNVELHNDRGFAVISKDQPKTRRCFSYGRI
jgi:hypothetical protein